MSEKALHRAEVLSALERGELSPAQAVKALKAPLPQRRRGRAWLPLWFRVAIVSQGRGVRLTLPLFVLGPLALVGFILLLPFAAFVVGLISIRKRAVLGYFLQGIGVLCALATTLLLHGRGAGVHVKDRDSEIGFWLS